MSNEVESIIRTAEISGYAKVSDLKRVKEIYVGLLAAIIDEYVNLPNDIKTDIGVDRLSHSICRAKDVLKHKTCCMCDGPLEYDRPRDDLCCACNDRKNESRRLDASIHQFKHNQFSEE